MTSIHLRISLFSLVILFCFTVIEVQTVVCPSYKYYDTATSTCQFCSYSCLSCTSATDCAACDSANDFRSLVNQKACLCNKGYYDDKVSTVCKTCTSRIANCNDCFYNSTYSAVDAASGARQYGCFGCITGFVLVNNACNAYIACPAGQGANPTTNVC